MNYDRDHTVSQVYYYRRNFIRLLAGAAPALVLDPERLLWVPGQRTHFVMPGLATGAEVQEATFALQEFHGIVDVSWKILQDSRASQFAFERAIDCMDSAFRARAFRLLNEDLLREARHESPQLYSITGR